MLEKRKPKFRSAIRQAVEVMKNGLSAIGVDLLRGTRRNTRQKNVDKGAMKEKLEKFCGVFRDEFLLFASDKLSKDQHLMEAIKQYTMEFVTASKELTKQRQQADMLGLNWLVRTRLICLMAVRMSSWENWPAAFLVRLILPIDFLSLEQVVTRMV